MSDSMFRDEDYMKIALEEAQQAAAESEVPVGAVLEYGGKILARDHNRMIQRKDPLAHAELLVLQAACHGHPDRWLLQSTLYVSLEPCVMCAGAIVLARIARLVFAAPDPKAGACGSIINVPASPDVNHHPQIESGLLQTEASAILRVFFKLLRQNT
jgi:tRNA(adenine34) deaminase